MIELQLTGGHVITMRSPLDDQNDWSAVVKYPNGNSLERRFRTPTNGIVRGFSAGTLEAWLYNSFPKSKPWVQFNWTDIKPKWLELVDTYLAATNLPEEETNP